MSPNHIYWRNPIMENFIFCPMFLVMNSVYLPELIGYKMVPVIKALVKIVPLSPFLISNASSTSMPNNANSSTKDKKC